MEIVLSDKCTYRKLNVSFLKFYFFGQYHFEFLHLLITSPLEGRRLGGQDHRSVNKNYYTHYGVYSGKRGKSKLKAISEINVIGTGLDQTSYLFLTICYRVLTLIISTRVFSPFPMTTPQQRTPKSKRKIKNLFILSVRISSYGCTREVWRARKMRKRSSRRSGEQL